MAGANGDSGSTCGSVFVIEVAFLYVDEMGQVYHKSLLLAENTPLRQAIIATGWLDLPVFAHIRTWLEGVNDGDLPNQKAWYVGVFSVKKPLDYLVKQGDRVEFYRPLCQDPMKKRQTKVLIAKKKQAQLDSVPRQRRTRQNLNKTDN